MRVSITRGRPVPGYPPLAFEISPIMSADPANQGSPTFADGLPKWINGKLVGSPYLMVLMRGRGPVSGGPAHPSSRGVSLMRPGSLGDEVSPCGGTGHFSARIDMMREGEVAGSNLREVVLPVPSGSGDDGSGEFTVAVEIIPRLHPLPCAAGLPAAARSRPVQVRRMGTKDAEKPRRARPDGHTERVVTPSYREHRLMLTLPSDFSTPMSLNRGWADYTAGVSGRQARPKRWCPRGARHRADGNVVKIRRDEFVHNTGLKLALENRRTSACVESLVGKDTGSQPRGPEVGASSKAEKQNCVLIICRHKHVIWPVERALPDRTQVRSGEPPGGTGDPAGDRPGVTAEKAECPVLFAPRFELTGSAPVVGRTPGQAPVWKCDLSITEGNGSLYQASDEAGKKVGSDCGSGRKLTRMVGDTTADVSAQVRPSDVPTVDTRATTVFHGRTDHFSASHYTDVPVRTGWSLPGDHRSGPLPVSA
ncbi:hypothetical protein Bbelb_233200 [Branchiostoma belcheri]|nr:hypothetical protein Bbelb_233200 [Branchiostoma belcheri]